MAEPIQRWVYVYGPGDYRLWTEDYTGDELVVDWKFRGPDGQILQEYEVLDVGATWNHVRDVIHGAEGPLAARYADGSERYFHTDHLGTPRVITKADGTKLSEHHYYPYSLEVPIEVESPVPDGFIFADSFETGDTSRWATPGSPQPPPEGPPPEELAVKYTGHERDLHRSTDYMLARSYAFLLGRFLSVDRVQDGWNRYGYARNNPIAFIDPDGATAQSALELIVIYAESIRAASEFVNGEVTPYELAALVFQENRNDYNLFREMDHLAVPVGGPEVKNLAARAAFLFFNRDGSFGIVEMNASVAAGRLEFYGPLSELNNIQRSIIDKKLSDPDEALKLAAKELLRIKNKFPDASSLQVRNAYNRGDKNIYGVGGVALRGEAYRREILEALSRSSREGREREEAIK